MIDIELTVSLHPDGGMLVVSWNDGEVLTYESELNLDLIPFIVARKLLSQGYNASRLLIVHLRGADYELMRAPLGAVAAPPLVNMAAPVERAARAVFKERHQ